MVTKYADTATATMLQLEHGGGHFAEVTLHPMVNVTEAWMVEKRYNYMMTLAHNLGKKADRKGPAYLQKVIFYTVYKKMRNE